VWLDTSAEKPSSTRYGHTNPEDAAEHIGFDLQPVAEA
jgi:hypothetical protein